VTRGARPKATAHPGVYVREVRVSDLLRLTRATLAPLALLVVASCASDAPTPSAGTWTGILHPPGPPGSSITATQKCECRACDPASCCRADQTENLGPSPPECNGSYVFSEKCGIQVQTCTPRCYSHVWRVGKQESCKTSRPLVCCD